MQKLFTQSWPARIAILLIAGHAALLSGCGLFGPSCDALRTELQSLYDDYWNETSKISDDAILLRCATALTTCPDLAIAHELAGLVHWENERMGEALEQYKKAVSLTPGDDELLGDAMTVAFETKGYYLYIDDDGKVRTAPFAKITVEQYAQIPSDIRLLWCDYALDKWMKPGTESKEIRDRRGETIGTTSIHYRSRITSPQDLDAVLLSLAKIQPLESLTKASGDLMLRHSSSDIITEFY
jgi:hypothetical protein